jgi:hypothetical protein
VAQQIGGHDWDKKCKIIKTAWQQYSTTIFTEGKTGIRIALT